MKARLADISALVALLTIAACASPVRTTELDRIDQFSGYRYEILEQKAPKTIDKAAIVLTFSGGGTRAAALADGVLHALADTEIKGQDGTLVPLASQVDLVSSVSGGSVTAAYFALGGIAGLADLERNFLYSDIMSKLLTRTLFNPLRLLYPRIDIFEGYLDDVFDHKTYQDLIDVDVPGKSRRPYVVLNAADMATGSVFSFNQDQFDLICADLAALKIADAVSASAAFPVALSPLTLKNRAPCDAQRNAPLADTSGWETEGAWPEPKRIFVDHMIIHSEDGMNDLLENNLVRYRRGTFALTYLNREKKKDFIQLLDGGIADNLGLTLPLTLFTSQSESPSFMSWANSGKANKFLLVVVNARGQPNNDFGKRDAPPGIVDTIKTAIGTPIDATSFQFLDQLSNFNRASVALIDFDLITDEDCRAHFHNIATSWTLRRKDVDDLIALGRAMVLQSRSYQNFVVALGGTMPAPKRSVAQICVQIHKPL